MGVCVCVFRCEFNTSSAVFLFSSLSSIKATEMFQEFLEWTANASKCRLVDHNRLRFVPVPWSQLLLHLCLLLFLALLLLYKFAWKEQNPKFYMRDSKNVCWNLSMWNGKKLLFCYSFFFFHFVYLTQSFSTISAVAYACGSCESKAHKAFNIAL